MNNMCGNNAQQNTLSQYSNAFYQPASDSSVMSPNWQSNNWQPNNNMMNQGNMGNWNNNWQNNMSQNQNSNNLRPRPTPIPPQRQSQPQLLPSRSMNEISITPETLTNIDFLPAYLSQHVGKWIRADFLIGGSLEERVGILNEVGASYIIIQAIEPATLVVCDMFSIKFVTIILDEDYTKLML